MQVTKRVEAGWSPTCPQKLPSKQYTYCLSSLPCLLPPSITMLPGISSQITTCTLS